ncbi:MAG: hypothetical protein JWO37_1543 [Acidimicrobiales bacterium]|jgi:hypothetical protein|nr:hypothetical protein [Acidimicrobiales bacterium]
MLRVVEPAGESDDAWDHFCELSPDAWFWHTSHWREYTLTYRPDLESRSRAFTVVEDGETLAAIPLMVEHHDNHAELSSGAGPCWSPAFAPGLSPARRASAAIAVYRQIDVVAAEEGVVRAALRLSPLAHDRPVSGESFLTDTGRNGYIDISLSSLVIGVDRPLEELRREMTKGHRSDISRAARSFTIDVFDASSITDTAFDEYRLLHQKAAGRVTRPAATFQMMHRWVQEGRALLVTARRDGEAKSCALVNLFGRGAYYSSAATSPGLREPAGHAVQWATIEWLQARGYQRYELGLQQFGPLPHDVPSEKERNIARFKRGFGGSVVPLLTREKWYDASAYSLALEARTRAYADAVDAEDINDDGR